MAAAEGVIFRLVPEQRLQPGHLEGGLHALFQRINQAIQRHLLGILRLQGSAHGGKEVGILRVHGGLLGQLQGADKRRLQFCQEVQRAAQEGNATPDRLAASQAGNGLVHHRLENGSSQVGFGSALVDQGLNIRLGKHTAAGGNGIDLLIILGRVVQACGIGLQQRRHLVNEGASAAGADAVHPLLQAAGEINDLGILAAQFDGHIGLGRGMLQRGGNRHHLLDKLHM